MVVKSSMSAEHVTDKFDLFPSLEDISFVLQSAGIDHAQRGKFITNKFQIRAKLST